MKKIFTPLLIALFAISSFRLSAQTTVNFNYTGSVQTFTVPPCVTSITVDVQGAKGGDKNTAIGGNGGRVQCSMPVTPGEILQIYVGGVGANGDNVSNTIAGGYNGGGTGFDNSDPWGGGGGGGGSDIRKTPYTLNDRWVVGGGGGGGGIDGCGSALLNGGAGGGLVGANGQIQSCNVSGTGGTQSAGGIKGQYTGCTNLSTDGSFGMGGNGYGQCSNSDEGGSGGGGGWYGGGAGNFGAGGGGSSYTNGACTGVTHTQGFTAGNGFVSITYNSSGSAPAQPGTISGPSQACAGSTVTYTISTVPGATSYSWTVPSGATINSGNGSTSINVTLGTTSGNVSVVANNSCGSSTAQTLSVTISSPVLTLSATPANCSGSCDGSITANTTGGISPYTYSPALTNLCAGIYTVTVTDAIGCTATGVATVTEPTAITASISASPTAICDGGCATINVTSVSGGTPGYTYMWTPGNMTGNSVTVCPSATTTYTFTATDANGCTGTATATITVNPLPTVTVSAQFTFTCIQWTTNALTGTPSGGIFSGTGVSGSNFNPSVAGQGSYYIVYTFMDGNGCTNMDSVQVTVDLCTGTPGPAEPSAVFVYPNPFSNTLTIIAGETKGSHLTLFNVLGEEVASWQLAPGKNEIGTETLPAGVYFVQVKTESGTITKKVIRQ